MDDLHWQATHQIGDITISIVQGNGCQGSRSSDTFEVLVWDSDGNIPLSDYDVGSYLSWQDVVDLIDLIKRFDDTDKKGAIKKIAEEAGMTYRTFADYQRGMYPNALCNTIDN